MRILGAWIVAMVLPAAALAQSRAFAVWERPAAGLVVGASANGDRNSRHSSPEIGVVFDTPVVFGYRVRADVSRVSWLFEDRDYLGAVRLSDTVTLESIRVDRPTETAEIWEKVIRKLRSGQMPPVGRPRPSPENVTAFLTSLEADLDRAAATAPNPGRPVTRRLNRKLRVSGIVLCMHESNTRLAADVAADAGELVEHEPIGNQ